MDYHRLGRVALTATCVGVVGVMTIPPLWIKLDNAHIGVGETVYVDGVRPFRNRAAGEVVSIENGQATLKSSDGEVAVVPLASVYQD